MTAATNSAPPAMAANAASLTAGGSPPAAANAARQASAPALDDGTQAAGDPGPAPAPQEQLANRARLSPVEPAAPALAAADQEPRDPASTAPAQRTEPALASGTPRPTYDELVEVGRALSKKNRRDESIEAFERALMQAPEASGALSGLGYVYLNASDNRRAQEYANRAVTADATNAEGWIVLGAARELLGDRAGALAAYRSCVSQGKGPYLLECRRVAR